MRMAHQAGIKGMADIFIGYARRDREIIEQLAATLEAADYSVWWDRQIIGGSEFSRDIERELNAARAVIIVWSRDASESPWVKDEAAVALDQNKLVPVVLGPEPPPMGFRQYQAVDFSRWKGQAGHPAVADLLRAVDSRIKGIEPAPVKNVQTAGTGKTKKTRGMTLGIAALALIAVYAGFHLKNSNVMERSASQSEPGESAEAMQPLNDLEPRIAVDKIKVRDSDPELANFAASLREDIASGLSRFSYLLVSSQAPADGGYAGAAYVLEGTLRRSGPTLRLTAQLIDASSGQQVWGETFDRAFDAARILDIQDDLTDHVVASVADPYGALMRDLSTAVALKKPQQMTPYETILRHFIYRQRIGPEDHLQTREALEHGVEIAPGNADIWAALGAIYSEEYKHDYNQRADSLDRALTAARKGIDLEPDNASANFALAEVYFFRKDLGAFRAAAERAIALNPRDSDAMAMIGIMTGYGGDWVRSVELTKRAMALNPTHPGWYRFNTFFDEYRQEHYEEALAIAQRINMPDYFADPYVRAMTHAQLGHTAEAARALDEFRVLWPGINLQTLGERHLQKWFYAQPELIRSVIDGLRKAGLEES